MSHGGKRENAGKKPPFGELPTRKVGITLTQQLWGYLAQIRDSVNEERKNFKEQGLDLPTHSITRNQVIEDMLRYAMDKGYTMDTDLMPAKDRSFCDEVKREIWEKR